MAFAYMPINGFDRSPEIEVARAFAYLGKSAFANEIITELTNITAVITIQVGLGVEPGYLHPSAGEDHGGIVRWDPGFVLNVTDKASSASGTQIVRPKVPWVEQHKERHGFLNLKSRRLDKPGTLSPAMGLMHELGHAHQFQQNPEGFREVKRNARSFLLEDNNVAGIENTVCLELNKAGASEGLRWDYYHSG